MCGEKKDKKHGWASRHVRCVGLCSWLSCAPLDETSNGPPAMSCVVVVPAPTGTNNYCRDSSCMSSRGRSSRRRCRRGCRLLGPRQGCGMAVRCSMEVQEEDLVRNEFLSIDRRSCIPPPRRHWQCGHTHRSQFRNEFMRIDRCSCIFPPRGRHQSINVWAGPLELNLHSYVIDARRAMVLVGGRHLPWVSSPMILHFLPLKHFGP